MKEQKEDKFWWQEVGCDEHHRFGGLFPVMLEYPKAKETLKLLRNLALPLIPWRTLNELWFCTIKASFSFESKSVNTLVVGTMTSPNRQAHSVLSAEGRKTLVFHSGRCDMEQVRRRCLGQRMVEGNISRNHMPSILGLISLPLNNVISFSPHVSASWPATLT